MSLWAYRDLICEVESKNLLVINMQTIVWNLFCLLLHQSCPVNLRLLGKMYCCLSNALTELINIHLLSCVNSFFPVWHCFLMLCTVLHVHAQAWKHSPAHENCYNWCTIHQYTLIRPCNDIHTFYTSWLKTLNFKEKKLFKIIKIRYDSNANNCLKNQCHT